MKKFLKLIFAVCMAACFLLFPMFMGNAPASAEEIQEPPVSEETTDETESVEDGLKTLVRHSTILTVPSRFNENSL